MPDRSQLYSFHSQNPFVSGVLICIKFLPVCDQKKTVNTEVSSCPFLARRALDLRRVGMGGRGLERPEGGRRAHS